MFTGIVEGTGRVVSLTRSGESARLRLDLGAAAEGLRPGDSVCVDGACLTATAVSGAAADFDLSAETLQRTTLGRLRSGDEVNLERALRLGDRLGGHFVLGHVDGVGTISSISSGPGQITLRVNCPAHLLHQLIPKGSVAVDGISLTVVEVTASDFSTAILPFTLQRTTLRNKRPGQGVNIETDILGKYVARLLGREHAAPEGGISEAFLRERGYA